MSTRRFLALLALLLSALSGPRPETARVVTEPAIIPVACDSVQVGCASASPMTPLAIPDAPVAVVMPMAPRLGGPAGGLLRGSAGGPRSPTSV